VGNNVGEDAESDISFALKVGLMEGLACEGVIEEMTELKKVIEPSPTLLGRHGSLEVGDPGKFGLTGSFLGLPYVFAVRGIIHHRLPVVGPSSLGGRSALHRHQRQRGS